MQQNTESTAFSTTASVQSQKKHRGWKQTQVKFLNYELIWMSLAYDHVTVTKSHVRNSACFMHMSKGDSSLTHMISNIMRDGECLQREICSQLSIWASMAVSTGLFGEFNVLFSLSSSADGTWCNKNPKPGGEKLEKIWRVHFPGELNTDCGSQTYAHNACWKVWSSQIISKWPVRLKPCTPE